MNVCLIKKIFFNMVTNFFIILALFMLYNQLASPRICAGTVLVIIIIMTRLSMECGLILGGKGM